jgi:CPA2 family monovalent cation:H+ antiporter-2
MPVATVAGPAGVVATLGLALLKVAAFFASMHVVGRRVVPWLLGRVIGTGSRELFTLGVLAIALGIAVGSAALFGVSFALGAFFAGVIVSESKFSHEAATNALPLQDAFAVLFFLSVGMLFDPHVLVRQSLQVLAVVMIVMVGKPLAALAIVLAFRYPLRTALSTAVSLAQIGEFSFILAALAVTLGLFPPDAEDLIIAGALLSITLNPLAFRAVEPLHAWLKRKPQLAGALERPAGTLAELPPAVDEAQLRDHVVVVGYGSVGAPVAEELAAHGVAHVVIEQNRERAAALRARGLPVIYGDAGRPEVLSDAHLERAGLVIITTPDVYQARAILSLARHLNPRVAVLVRTHSDEEREYLESHGAERALVGERELAASLTRRARRHAGIAHDMAAVAERTLCGAAPVERDGAGLDGEWTK